MKLTAKIVSFWMAGTLVVVAAGTFFAIRHDVRLLQENMRADASEVGRTLAPLIQDAWQTNGEQRALQLLADANRDNRQVNVRWVWLDDPSAENPIAKFPASNLQELRGGNLVFVEDREPSGKGFLRTYVPVPVVSTRTGAIELTNSLDALDRIADSAIRRFVASGVALVVLSAAAAAALGIWLVGRPLGQLTDKTRRAGAGDLSNPVHLIRNDELAELGLSLNLMCNQLAAARERLRAETDARIAALEQLRHADRLKTVGRLASGMAHELGTPMNVVLARAELIGLEAPSETAVESVKIIKAQIQCMASMIRQLLDFGRRGRAHKQPIDLDELSRRTVQLLDPLAKRQNITLELRPCQADVNVEVDNSQIQQVLSNIIENAIHAMPKGGKVCVAVESGPFPPVGNARMSEQGYARLAIDDQGIGIPAENLEHIFDPFFTTKDVGKGTGLGLSIAYGIVQDHGGWIEVTSTPGVGSRFLIYLPRAGTLKNRQETQAGAVASNEAFADTPNATVAKQESPLA
ncbi:MAG TPA: HAMP domain-containing sensor histidine kinase [Planctomycetaceae bacterium]|jgi:two-component system NtrC family sensor kinase|nr:HAMP domain-containing sensor histidine kinase [Planctomycetaceae bacterium]